MAQIFTGQTSLLSHNRQRWSTEGDSKHWPQPGTVITVIGAIQYATHNFPLVVHCNYVTV